jgi:hypothetical protein
MISLRVAQADTLFNSNGTSTNCLAEVLNSTAVTNNRDFFTNMISGMNIQWYEQSFFGVKWCTGCYYELYKAAMFLIPSIQGLEQVHWLGGNLTQCTEPADVKWGGRWLRVESRCRE